MSTFLSSTRGKLNCCEITDPLQNTHCILPDIYFLLCTVRNLVQSSVWAWVPFQCNSELQWGRGVVPFCAHSLFTLWEHRPPQHQHMEPMAYSNYLTYNWLSPYFVSTGTTQEGPYHQGGDCLKSLSTRDVSAGLFVTIITVVQSYLIKKQTKEMCLRFLLEVMASLWFSKISWRKTGQWVLTL